MTTTRDATKIIRAMRETDIKPVVYIDRLASGVTAFGVKVAARSIKHAREKAEAAFDALAKKYKGEK